MGTNWRKLARFTQKTGIEIMQMAANKAVIDLNTP